MNESLPRGLFLGLIAVIFVGPWVVSGELRASQQEAHQRPATLEKQHPYLKNLLDATAAQRRTILTGALDPADEAGAGMDVLLYERLVRDGLANSDWSAATTSGSEEAGGEHGTNGASLPELLLLLDRVDRFQRDPLKALAEPDTTAANRAVETLVNGYFSDSSTSLASVPKDMAILEEGTAAGAFGQAYPRLHGLIWAHQWLELALFEPLIRYYTPEKRQGGVIAVVARFWSMLEEPPRSFPTQMPMAPTIARSLAVRHPQAAAILENRNMLYQAVTDILAEESDPDPDKAIRSVLTRFQDPSYRATSWYEWNRMAILHGIGNQGGWAFDIIPDPERTEAHLDHHGHGLHHGTMPGM
ncbi:MAG: hypothetical protein ACOC5J_01085 [Gemmatimonadota bacterium]